MNMIASVNEYNEIKGKRLSDVPEWSGYEAVSNRPKMAKEF